MTMTVASIHALSARLREIGMADTTEVFIGCPDSGIQGAPDPVEPIVSVSHYDGDGTEPGFICLDIADPNEPAPTQNIDEIISAMK